MLHVDGSRGVEMTLMGLKQNTLRGIVSMLLCNKLFSVANGISATT